MGKNTPICSGDFRTKIIVQKPMTISDGQGGFQPTEWVEYFRFYGSVEWGKGKEVMNADRLQSWSWCKITTYYDVRFDTTLRLVFNNQILNMRNVTNLEERNKLSELSAELGCGT